MKTLAEIREAAAKNYQSDYHGKTEDKGGYTYIPWDRAVDLAIQIFDVDGFDVEIVRNWREDVQNEKGETTYGYGAVVRLSVYATDLARPIVRDGLGFNEMEFTKERSGTKDGQPFYVPSRAMIDAAIKGAASGALLRALVLLGNAFGLYLYTGATPAPTSNGSTPSAPVRSSGKGPTEGQIPHLLKNFGRYGLTDEHIKAMKYETAKALLDGLWRDKKPPAQVLSENGFQVGTPKGDGLPIPVGSH